MTQFHFVKDYERHVRRLRLRYSRDKAMSLAVGGDYERMGQKEAAIVAYAGLRDGQSLLDFGCGSGRLAAALQHRMSIEYCGIDVVRSLLKYAKKACPDNYRFILNHSLDVPLPDASVDMCVAFSVFTHLHHHESFIYLEEIHRVVRPGGTVVFSFLEFRQRSHWQQFETTVTALRNRALPHLNQFIERRPIRLWARKLGYEGVSFIDITDAPWGEVGPLGQSLAILQR